MKERKRERETTERRNKRKRKRTKRVSGTKQDRITKEGTSASLSRGR
jgi:hypothetical protein